MSVGLVRRGSYLLVSGLPNETAAWRHTAAHRLATDAGCRVDTQPDFFASGVLPHENRRWAFPAGLEPVLVRLVESPGGRWMQGADADPAARVTWRVSAPRSPMLPA